MNIPARSILQHGSESVLVEAECHVSNGLPAVVIVGLGGRAVDEARERIRGAFATSHLTLPPKRIVINLAPADIPKDSTALDLPIAAAILSASQQIQHRFLPGEAFLGEVGLDGSIRPIRGIIGALLAGQKLGITTFFIPQANYQQACLVPGVILIPLKNIVDLSSLLATSNLRIEAQMNQQPTVGKLQGKKNNGDVYCQIVGQPQAKRALKIAAAGGHNILLSGPPGTGKSMLAKALQEILPEMSYQEMLEVTHIHSLANSNYEQLIDERPFRSPHHSATLASLIGGGSNIRPGEISLGHRGVLFLDEFPEFTRSAIEALRQPLEDGEVAIVRATQRAVFPADFILVATANPCPCGFFGIDDNRCQCTAAQIGKYRFRLSGPILDRIDLHVSVETVDHVHLLDNNSRETSVNNIRQQVQAARAAQAVRFRSETKLNSHMNNQSIKDSANVTLAAQQCLNEAARRLSISARSYMRILKISRTIADLEQSATIEIEHIAEALQYRPKTLSP